LNNQPVVVNTIFMLASVAKTAMSAPLFLMFSLLLSPDSSSLLPDAREEHNIAYVTGGDNQQQLDLYLPAEADSPTIMFVHGGSLTSEDRNDSPYVTMCRTFQSLGIAVANTNYRLAPTSRWPAMPEDIAAAFAWVKANISSRRGDPARIFLLGHSSGCHLVTLIASDPRYLDAHNLRPNDIAGIIAMGCLLNDWDTAGTGFTQEQWLKIFDSDQGETQVFRTLEDRIAANPSLYIGNHMPAVLILVAEAERFQPPILEQGAAFVRKAREAGVEADIDVLKDRKHYSAVHNMVSKYDPTLLKILDFVNRHNNQ
jgi:acetyl esterase/lipase